MSLHDPDLYVLLGQLEWSAFSELNDVMDYIYKSPRLLMHEKELEKRKLAEYFPQSGVTADVRYHYESLKLDKTFPRLIAMANLFLALSVFENYVFKLAKILQAHDPDTPNSEMSRGVAGHIKALKAYGAEPYGAKYYEQVLIAISIRNCLMHSKGLLATFRQADTLRAQIDQCKLRARRSQQDSPLNEYVTFEGIGADEQLLISNDYAHLVCFYLREYFRDLCGTLNPNIALRPTTIEMDVRDLTSDEVYRGPIM